MRFIKKEAGFVLVELIIVTVILGAVFPLSIYFINSMKAARETKIQQTANYLAQKYMEEYKAKDLAVIVPTEEEPVELIQTTINGRLFCVSAAIKPFLDPVDAANCIGNMEIISNEGSAITIKMDNSNIPAVQGETYTLRLTGDPRTRFELFKDEAESEPYVFSVTLPAGEPGLEPDPELNLYIKNIKNDPGFTLEVKNELEDRKLIINRIEEKTANESPANPKFTLDVVQGKVKICNREPIEAYQQGAHIIITVKDKNDKVLAEVVQTRFIEWTSSQG
jgi:type II secretory pathway pseudopilin PulG